MFPHYIFPNMIMFSSSVECSQFIYLIASENTGLLEFRYSSSLASSKSWSTAGHERSFGMGCLHSVKPWKFIL